MLGKTKQRVKLKAQVTYPLRDTSEVYWKCIGRGCQHYQTVRTGTTPESLNTVIKCPACKTTYKVLCLGRTGASINIVAELMKGTSFDNR